MVGMPRLTFALGITGDGRIVHAGPTSVPLLVGAVARMREAMMSLYWFQDGTWKWNDQDETEQRFGVKCLDYYCETMELQQESIFLFLLFWNKTTGVKGPGRMIGQMVWEGRYDCLVKEFGE